MSSSVHSDLFSSFHSAAEGSGYRKPDPFRPLAKHRSHLQEIRSLAVISGMGIVLVWIVGVRIAGIVRNRRWVAPGRKAHPNAGLTLKAMLGEHRRFVARERSGGARQIEIDAGESRVTFRNFSFVTSFWRNPAQDKVELNFNELLIATAHMQKGTQFLRLRTARGAVVVYDRIEPFDKIAPLLVDIAELNRVSPEKFRAMLQRELKVKTPGSAWFLFAGAVGAVVAFGWWLWNLSAR